MGYLPALTSTLEQMPQGLLESEPDPSLNQNYTLGAGLWRFDRFAVLSPLAERFTSESL